MTLHEVNINGCRLPLTICGGNTQLHMGRLAVRAQINWEGCLELGVCWNHTSLPISFLQLSVQFSLLQNTYPSASEFQHFHSKNLENIHTSQFSFLSEEGCTTAIPKHFQLAMSGGWIKHEAVDTWATMCLSALPWMDLSSVCKPLLKKHLTYIIFKHNLTEFQASVMVVICCSNMSLLFPQTIFLKCSPSSHKCDSYTLAVLPALTQWPDPLTQSPLTPKLVYALKITLCSHKLKHKAEGNPAPNTTALARGRSKESIIKIQKASSELAQGASQMQRQEPPADNLTASWQALACLDCPTTASQITPDLYQQEGVFWPYTLFKQYLCIFLIIFQFQQQILFLLTKFLDKILLSTCIHEVPFHVLTSWQIASDCTETKQPISAKTSTAFPELQFLWHDSLVPSLQQILVLVFS